MRHFSIVTLLIVYTFLSCGILFARQERGIRIVIQDSESGETVKPYNARWAIIIGIDKYRNVRNLDYAVADAVSMKELLMKKFGYPESNIALLKDGDATQENIKKSFGRLYRINQDDQVIIFFAGHGETIDLATGGQMGFLLPVESRGNSAEDLYSSCISMQSLKELSSFVPAKHVLFLIDACYGGLAASGARSLPKETRGYIRKVTSARARQIITAGGRGETVAESAEWGHSAFTYKLLDGLNKGLADLDDDGLIRGSELASYLQLSVSTITENRQTPQFRSFVEDEGEFLFILPERGPTRIAASQSESIPRFGDLFVKSTPDAADILIDGKPTNSKTPDLLLKISSGEHSVTVTKMGVEAKQVVKIVPDQINRIELSLDIKEAGLQGSVPFTPSDRSSIGMFKLMPQAWNLAIGYSSGDGFGSGFAVSASRNLFAVSENVRARLGLTFHSTKKDYSSGYWFGSYSSTNSVFQVFAGTDFVFNTNSTIEPHLLSNLLYTNVSPGSQSLFGLEVGGGIAFPLSQNVALMLGLRYQIPGIVGSESGGGSANQSILSVGLIFGK